MPVRQDHKKRIGISSRIPDFHRSERLYATKSAEPVDNCREMLRDSFSDSGREVANTGLVHARRIIRTPRPSGQLRDPAKVASRLCSITIHIARRWKKKRSGWVADDASSDCASERGAQQSPFLVDGGAPLLLFAAQWAAIRCVRREEAQYTPVAARLCLFD